MKLAAGASAGLLSVFFSVGCANAQVGTELPQGRMTVPDAAQRRMATPPPVMTATQLLNSRLSPGQQLNGFLDQIRNWFRSMDANDDGAVSNVDADVVAEITAAMARTMMLLQIMRADLDGDGAVTADELRRFQKYEARALPPKSREGLAERNEKSVRDLMAADRNGDGRITMEESLAFAKEKQSPLAAGLNYGNQVPQVLAFAAPGAMSVTLAEVEVAADAFFRTVDVDNDGKISPEELAEYRKKLDEPNRLAREAAMAAQKERDQASREANAKMRAEREARVQQQAEDRAACVMPKASEQAKVVVLSAYETDTLSNVAIGSQDEVTQAGLIHVERGSEPVYLVVVSFNAVIWRLTGAVERVERLVLNSTRGSRTGVTGLAADRLTFLRGNNCLRYFDEAPSTASATTVGKVAREVGKSVDGVAAKYAAASFSVPSAKAETLREANAPKVLVIQKSAGTLTVEGDPRGVIVQTPGRRSLEGELRRFSPGGVVDIDPDKVVASEPVARYEVLPQQAGLIQLVDSGALAQNGRGEFLIKQKIRFPAGLNGAHSVSFVLLRGVPEPEGDPGHSGVISEETGLPVGKSKRR